MTHILTPDITYYVSSFQRHRKHTFSIFNDQA